MSRESDDPRFTVGDRYGATAAGEWIVSGKVPLDVLADIVEQRFNEAGVAAVYSEIGNHLSFIVRELKKSMAAGHASHVTVTSLDGQALTVDQHRPALVSEIGSDWMGRNEPDDLGPEDLPPILPPLDVHGVGDDGAYQPPSRARYEELIETRVVLEGRVDELLARGTTLQNECRMWKARAIAAGEVLMVLAVETPILHRMVGHGVTEDEVREVGYNALDVHERIDLLERDAWTRAAQVARQMVSAYDHGDVGPDDLDKWVGKLREALE